MANIPFPLRTQLALPLRLCQTLTSLMQPRLEPIRTLLLGWQQRLQVSVIYLFIYPPTPTGCAQEWLAVSFAYTM